MRLLNTHLDAAQSRSGCTSDRGTAPTLPVKIGIIVAKGIKTVERRVMVMLESELLHQRAKKCRELAATAEDKEIERKLVALADEYEAKATRTNATERTRSRDE